MLVQIPKTSVQIVAMEQDHPPAVDNTNRKEYTMNTAEKVRITVDVEAEELWSSVFGSGFESDPVNDEWLRGFRFIQGDWETPGLIELDYLGEDERYHKQTYNVHDLAGALSTAIAKSYHHVPCGGKIDADFSNYDSCVGDLLLQVMVYGEETFA
jgi:hypothetical protein